MATHSSILAWENPTDRGSWRATIQGVAKSCSRLSEPQELPALQKSPAASPTPGGSPPQVPRRQTGTCPHLHLLPGAELTLPQGPPGGSVSAETWVAQASGRYNPLSWSDTRDRRLAYSHYGE